MLSTLKSMITGRTGTTSLEEESSPSSAEIMASSNDLLSEILRRVPVKSLLKFKSVSKHWRSLITDPDFSRLKIHNLKPPSALFLQDQSNFNLFFVPLDPSNSHTTAPFTDRDFLSHDPPGMEIMHSCNGLLLLCCHRDYDNFYICNPTTKQFKTLPPILGDADTVLRMAIAFDPSESHLYKVICLQEESPTSSTVQIRIYSQETGSWRFCGATFEPLPATDFGGGVYFNGAIHWITPRGANSQYFDVKEEVIREMSMPLGHGGYSRYFGETHGHLHLVEDYMFSRTDIRFNVWEMERDRSRWFLKFRVGRYDLEYFRQPFRILCVVRGVKDEDTVLVVFVPGKIISREENVPGNIIAFNLSTRSHRKIAWFEGDMHPGNYAFQFIESLSPV